MTQPALGHPKGILGLYTSADQGRTWKLSITTASITSGNIYTVAAGNDNLFRALCGALERDFAADERFATNSKRVENRHALIPMLEKIFRERPIAEWLIRLDAAGVPAAPIENVAQVAASSQTAALGILQRAPDLDMTLAGLPLEFDGVRPPYRNSAPTLGEHNNLLAEPLAKKKAAS